ncbi:hypothetical protein Pyrfu_1481 [Pyrolobus fumarii 1A]|uniref:Uncharacterized protein n=1 Tax=Pyrolobus fumarii (strain DSM 11204 / 1A) TaxID=694429 RepID=G0EHI6_PYRF1|nr:hypothetical protein [Pyrolobus fumarii]AEM39339.1 hypothetical protein Pyrfu_1481 [Pyrolobus fumarii 1A]
MRFSVRVENGRLIIRNESNESVRIDTVEMEYLLTPLSYDRREPRSEPRRAVERVKLDLGLLPGGEVRLRLRDVERVERVCIEVGDKRVCYHP